MNKTYVTKMPNHIGAFLKASRCFASLGINITRVSYNKAVDSHMLFIDAEGTPEQLERARDELIAIGYLQCDEENRKVVLVEFKLKDEPGSVTDILELINDYNFNISYISSQENGTEYQMFKMGLLVDNDDRIKEFTDEAKKICALRVIDYNHADKIFDNSFFYNTFVNELSSSIEITNEKKNELIVNTNLAMQILDESGVSPYKTFDSISRFAELLSKSMGEEYLPRITMHTVSDATTITLIEPPCGSNTAIIKSGGDYLFVDTGYACYKNEMLNIFKNLIPNFDKIEKKVFVTHADVDHCGLLPMFDKIYAGAASAECMKLAFEGKDDFREKNPLHKPYIKICKVLTSFEPVSPDKIEELSKQRNINKPIEQTAFFDFGELHFDLFEGKGGHLKGESILIDFEHRIAFTGDIFVNLKDMTERQAEYNRYAPILMTSVDTDKELCKIERTAFFQRLGIGDWHIFGGHGGIKSWRVTLA